MRNKAIPAVIATLGAVITAVSGVCLALEFSRKSGEIKDLPAVTEKLEAAFSERSAAVFEERSNTEMPMIDINGGDYIGILELPQRNIKLPVAAAGSKEKSCPARYEGSIYNGSLIIGGKYGVGFDFADKADAGESVRFTDITGKCYELEIIRISRAEKTDAEHLEFSEPGLILFTEKSGKTIVIRCGLK